MGMSLKTTVCARLIVKRLIVKRLHNACGLWPRFSLIQAELSALVKSHEEATLQLSKELKAAESALGETIRSGEARALEVTSLEDSLRLLKEESNERVDRWAGRIKCGRVGGRVLN